MRNFILAVTCLCYPLTAALANDGGVAVVTVKGIDPGEVKEDSVVKFYGKNAGNFMNLLPAAASVIPDIAKHNHSLVIKSPAWSLIMHCADADVSWETGKVSQLPNGTECSVSLSKVSEFGDTWELEQK